MLLENSKVGIQMAARIVDTPCNEMNTDAFLNEVNFFLRCKIWRFSKLYIWLSSSYYPWSNQFYIFTDPYSWTTLRYSTNNHSRPGAERKRIRGDLWCRSRCPTSTSTRCIESWANRRNTNNRMGRKRNRIRHWRSFYQGTDFFTSLFE